MRPLTDITKDFVFLVGRSRECFPHLRYLVTGGNVLGYNERRLSLCFATGVFARNPEIHHITLTKHDPSLRDEEIIEILEQLESREIILRYRRTYKNLGQTNIGFLLCYKQGI